MKYSIKNGRLVDPKHGTDGQFDLHLADGKVAAITASNKVPDGFGEAKVINANNSIVCPGLVDLSVRLPGLEKELAAAVAGGITTLACPPDARPALDEPGLVERLVRRAADAGLARVLPVGALTIGLEGQALAELGNLAAVGCVAFSQGSNNPIVDTQVLLRAMQYASTFGFALRLRPEDKFLARDGVAHDGEVATRLGLPGIPAAAETVAIATALELVRATGARLHFTRISSAGGMDLLRRARDEGLPISCDVSVHHLHLTDMDIGYFESSARFAPPLRAQRDREALSAAVADGVAAICSDHTPINEDGKQLPFGESDPGATGCELLLPLTLKWGQSEKLPLAKTLSRISCDPANILGVPGGGLAIGSAADVCVFDPEALWTVSDTTLVSKGKNTPFHGYSMQGKVTHTLVGGRLVFST